MIVSFDIPGKPFAWRRARSNGRHRFKDRASEAHEATVQAIALPHFPKPLDGPIRLTVNATFAIPQSWSKKRREATIHRPHTQKPDADNLGKQIADALNRIAWADDSQIYEVRVRKMWGLADMTHVWVEQ